MKTTLKLCAIILFPFLIGLTISNSEKEPIPSFTTHELNPDHIQGPFTGGFGEETCRSCHFDYDLNMEGGSLIVDGIPGTFKPGAAYEISVTVESEQLEVGGFQMTARFEDGSQAGSLDWDRDLLRFTPNIDGDVQYLQHSEAGTEPTGQREVSWSFTWIAPDSAEGTAIFNITANAGNDDDSSFGDWIYAKEIKSEAK
jgi:hypothetical protein